jgi:hypothetical protein
MPRHRLVVLYGCALFVVIYCEVTNLKMERVNIKFCVKVGETLTETYGTLRKDYAIRLCLGSRHLRGLRVSKKAEKTWKMSMASDERKRTATQKR